MAYNFRGTVVKGTSEKDFLTPGARRNYTYLNTQTGHVYVCTEVHTDWHAKGWAKWKYIRTDLIGKPNQGIFGLSAPTRDSNGWTMRAKWITYDWQKNTQNGRRMTGQYRMWQVNSWIKGKHYPLQTVNVLGINTTETTTNLNNFVAGGTAFTRRSFYPFTDRIISSVSCIIYTQNEKGKGPYMSVYRNFEIPRKPSISEPTFNANNGQLSFNITTNAGEDFYERYDTRYRVTVTNTRTGGTPTVVTDTSTTSTDFTTTFDATDYMQMSYTDYIKVQCEAWSRGFRGDSDHVSRTYYISYPAEASITGTHISSEDSIGKCTVLIRTNQTAEHPVDGVKLEYLANVDYSDPNLIPGDASWSDTDIVDDGDCTALSVAVTKLIPDKGKYTWLRVKSWHAAEGRLYRYSSFWDVMHKEPPTAEDDEITIISAEPASGGQSIKVQLGWNKSGEDDSTGTELSWSDELDTWKSTKNPESYTFTWDDGEITDSRGNVYHSSADITIKGLKEGNRYYIKARRYLESDTISYSDYSDYATCVTSEIPESIVASCDRYIPVGSSLPVYWTFSGNGIQTRWQIEALASGSDENIVLAEGSGSAGFAQISAERFASHATNGTITIRVGASTGSSLIWSEWRTVTAIAPPTIGVDADSLLTAQPFSFTVTASTACRLVVIVTSDGASGQFPTGRLVQTAGDTIHSDIYEPVWSSAQNGVTATVTVPAGLDFWNLGNYTLTVTGIDNSTGLRSETVTHKFSVAWATPAVDPFGAVTLTPIDETDDAGAHRKAVEIALTAPTGSSETDVYDIYRLNGDGAQLIGEGFPLNHVVADEYAPYGDGLTLYYRIALRTVDGDISYSDFEYEAEGDYLRFDWDGYYLESPYSVVVGDSYSKDVDIRQHMDGTSSGYWNSNIQRKSSLSTDVIRIIQPTEVDLARRLGRHAGTVFVRTPNGDAYEADVQVTDLSSKNKAVYAIAFDATEVGLTQEFMLPIPQNEEEEEEP